MAWLYLLLALAAFAAALTTSSMLLMVACLLAALGLLVAWAMALFAKRAGGRRDEIPLPRDIGSQGPGPQ